jgi:uncharacterized protein YbjT (DUF2867 family)
VAAPSGRHRTQADPARASGLERSLGIGRKATNFVSARDLAAFVDLAVADSSLRGQTIVVGGPNMTFDEFAEGYARAVGVRAKTGHFPLPAMRVMQHVLRPFNLALARQIQMGVVIDTRDTSLTAAEERKRFPPRSRSPRLPKWLAPSSRVRADRDPDRVRSPVQ